MVSSSRLRIASGPGTNSSTHSAYMTYYIKNKMAARRDLNCWRQGLVAESTAYRELYSDTHCLQTSLLIFKFCLPLNKRNFSTASKALVGTLMTGSR